MGEKQQTKLYFHLIHAELTLNGDISDPWRVLMALNLLLYTTKNIWRDAFFKTPPADVERTSVPSQGSVQLCRRDSGAAEGITYSFTCPGLFQIKGPGQLAMRVL